MVIGLDFAGFCCTLKSNFVQPEKANGENMKIAMRMFVFAVVLSTSVASFGMDHSFAGPGKPIPPTLPPSTSAAVVGMDHSFAGPGKPIPPTLPPSIATSVLG